MDKYSELYNESEHLKSKIVLSIKSRIRELTEESGFNPDTCVKISVNGRQEYWAKVNIEYVYNEDDNCTYLESLEIDELLDILQQLS